MSFTPVTTKISTKKINVNSFNITINVTITNDTGGAEVLNKNYSTVYNKAWSVGDVRLALQDQIRLDWDDYVLEEELFTNIQLDGMVSDINNTLTNYIN